MCNEFGYGLGREILAARFTGVGSIVTDKKFVGIPKQIDLIVFEISKIEYFYAFQYFCQGVVFGFYGIAQPCTGGIEIGK